MDYVLTHNEKNSQVQKYGAHQAIVKFNQYLRCLKCRTLICIKKKNPQNPSTQQALTKVHVTQLIFNAVDQKTVSNSCVELLHRQGSLTVELYKLEKTKCISFRQVSVQQSLNPILPYDTDLMITCLSAFLHGRRGCKSLRNQTSRFFFLIHSTIVYKGSQHVKQHCENKPGQNIETHCYSSTENTGTMFIQSTCEFGLHNILIQGCFKHLFKNSSSTCSFTPVLYDREVLLPFCELRVVGFFLTTTFICYYTS